jgi:hypothetical protein
VKQETWQKQDKELRRKLKAQAKQKRRRDKKKIPEHQAAVRVENVRIQIRGRSSNIKALTLQSGVFLKG